MLTIRDAKGSPTVKFSGRTETYQSPIEAAPPIMMVGPTERGPAFVPVEVNNWNQLESTFGMGETYTTYSAREALRETDRVSVIRVMNEEGWTPTCIALYVNSANIGLDEDSYLTFPLYADDIVVSENVLLLSLLTLEKEFEQRIDKRNIEVTGIYPERSSNYATIDNMTLRFYEDTGTLEKGDLIREYTFSFNRKSKNYIVDVLAGEPVNIHLNYYETQQKLVDHFERERQRLLSVEWEVGEEDESGDIEDIGIDSITVNGSEYQIDENTVFERFNALEDLTIHDPIIIRFERTNDGLIATRVKSLWVNNTVDYIFDFDENPLDLEDRGYTYAMTPWVLSQKTLDGKNHPLFRFVALSAGNSENTRFKIGIKDIGEPILGSDYKFFTVQIRDINDTDFDPIVLEEYRRVTLDPNHDRFISRLIGDRFDRFVEDRVESFGNFPNQSEYVRIELHPKINLVDQSAVPFGFEEYMPTSTGDLLNAGRIIREIGGEPIKSFGPKYKTEQSIGRITDYTNITRPEIGGSLQSKIHLGFDFDVNENWNYLHPVPDPYFACYFRNPRITEPSSPLKLMHSSKEESMDVLRCEQIMEEHFGHDFLMEDYGFDVDASELDEKKFVMGMQGGFDGTDPYLIRNLDTNIYEGNLYGFDLTNYYSSGMKSYRKALDLIREPEGGYQFNLLVTPGVMMKYHADLILEVEELIRSRGDAFYIFDSVSREDRIQEALMYGPQIQSNYVATYYGWLDVRNYDSMHDYVPPSCVVPKVYARNDRVAEPWYAPAGLKRGRVEDVQDVRYRLSEEQMALLYDECINPINYFGRDGICIWGQKTLYKSSSRINRINVRRLLVTIKSALREISRNFLFEQNTQQNRREFRRLIVDYLNEILSKEGLYDFRVQISNESTAFIATGTDVEHTMAGKIELIPASVNEYLLINFTVLQEEIIFT